MKLFTKYGTRSNEIRRAKREFYFRLTAILGIGLFLVMMFLLGRLSPSIDRDEGNDNISANAVDDETAEVEMNRLRSKVDAKLEEFEEAAADGEVEPEDLEILETAIDLQRKVIRYRPSRIASKDDIEKLENITTRRDEHMGSILLGQSEVLEEEAMLAYENGNRESALHKMELAHKLQKEINTTYSNSSSKDPTRLHKLDLKLSEWQTRPQARKAENLREEAWEALDQKEWKTARQKMKEALEIQKELHENHRGSRFASYSTLKSFQQDWESIQAAEDKHLIDQSLKKAEAFLHDGEPQEALAQVENAMALHERLLSQFPNSRFAKKAEAKPINELRDSAASYELNQAISQVSNTVFEALRNRRYENLNNQISDLYRKCTRLHRQFSNSRYLNASRRNAAEFLFEKRSVIKLLHSLIYERLKGIPDRHSLLMFETEVPQNLYNQVTGQNPSNNQGPRFPVESVTLQEAQSFCRDLAILLGFQTRLPSKTEFLTCLGEPDLDDLNGESWNSQNTERETQAVATSLKNTHGFYDLLGNVAEWVEAGIGESRNSALAMGGSVRDNPLLLANVPEDSREMDERNRFIGFRFVVDRNNPFAY